MRPLTMRRMYRGPVTVEVSVQGDDLAVWMSGPGQIGGWCVWAGAKAVAASVCNKDFPLPFLADWIVERAAESTAPGNAESLAAIMRDEETHDCTLPF